jgi:molecular chaperone DnaJ
MAKKDYYEVLGVNKNSTEDEIKKAYRRLAQQYHPDRNRNNKESEERFKDINEAYQVLRDPEKRAQYDAFGQGYQNYGGYPPGTGPGPGPGYYYSYAAGPDGFNINLEDLLEGFGPGSGRRRSKKGRGGFRDIFSDLFGGAGPGAQRVDFDFGETRPLDMEAEMTITFEDAVRGGTHTLQLSVPETCTACRGTGRSGKGMCITCGGTGQVMKPETFTVRVPAGVREGGRLRIPGKGRSDGGGKKGDLYIKVHVKPHRFFRREGYDIHLEVPVTVTEAALGASITVPTIDGKATLKVPPGTQSGQKLRLRGKGVKHPKGKDRGDQFVHVEVQVPKHLDEKTRKLLEQLKESEKDNPRKHLL